MATYDGELVVGGTGQTGDGVAAKGVISWDGESWKPLGSGLDGAARSFIELDGELIVGGGFVTAGETRAPRIARWDGEYWSPIGEGVRGADALALFDGRIYAGGGVIGYYDWVKILEVVSWDGVQWQRVGAELWSTLDARITSMIVHDGRLVLAGVGLSSVRNIGYLTDDWEALGSGIAGTVHAMAIYDGDLVVGGSFDEAFDLAARNIARLPTE